MTTQVITEALGHELAYTREAYKREHQDRDPEADGLTSQSMEIDGEKHQVYKAMLNHARIT